MAHRPLEGCWTSLISRVCIEAAAGHPSPRVEQEVTRWRGKRTGKPGAVGRGSGRVPLSALCSGHGDVNVFDVLEQGDP